MTSGDFSSNTPDGLGADPLAVFTEWQRTAVERALPAADALSFATATRDGRPSVRTVLYKGMRDGAVRLVTNYESRKGQEIAQNPHAALVFFWPLLDRQVRMEGTVGPASAAESDEYFAARKRESQLGAWASHQSRPLASRAELDAELARVRQRFEGKPVERPPHWGVLHFVPERVELWIGGSHRLHDRFLYERDGATWRLQRLAP